jgi:glycosyltransferase involved in cell wall biosynthesis
MQLKKVHIVAFDVPYPANYGGVIDVFYKLKALYENGVQIHLHLFQYGNRLPQPALEEYCTQVNYYKRKAFDFRVWLPYIVATRSAKQLLVELLKDDSPILFEAVHSSFFLDHPALKKRVKMLRMHNIEHDYYQLLAKQEKSIFKKTYYTIEALLLKRFQKQIQHAQVVFAISKNDQIALQSQLKNPIELLPAFHANFKVISNTISSDFCLYHGKLSVAENHQAALFLVNEVFASIKTKLIIAGSGASSSLKNAIKSNPNIQLLDNISQERINELVQEAQINIMPTFQPTGIKLKLINVLYMGKHVLVNNEMVSETGLEELTVVANSAIDMQNAVLHYMQIPFTASEIEKRGAVLKEKFDTQNNIQFLLKYL